MSPGHTRRVLLILPRLTLPPDCSASFTVSRSELGQSSTVFSSCSSTQHPIILTGQSNNLWVEFKAGHKSVAQGFQLTVLSVQGETPPLSCQYFPQTYHFRGVGISGGRYHQYRRDSNIRHRSERWQSLPGRQDPSLQTAAAAQSLISSSATPTQGRPPVKHQVGGWVMTG